MADYSYGVVKVNGSTATGYESLTSNFEFITISTAIPIYTFNQVLTANSWTVGTATANQLAQARASQAALDKLIQIVSLRGQPVIMGTVGLNSGTYSVIMAVEHPAAWSSTATSSSTPSFSTVNTANPNVFMADARANEDLVNRIKADGVNFGFGTNVSGLVYNDPISGGSYSLTVNDSSVLAVTYSAVLT
jgi:hypothetical protein